MALLPVQAGTTQATLRMLQLTRQLLLELLELSTSLPVGVVTLQALLHLQTPLL
jgi:hypothetical protein